MSDTRIPPNMTRLSTPEFIALMGMVFATVAFSIDAMLPALPEIAEELTPDAITLAQLVLTSFVLGMGAGTLVTGPLSDAFGRKPVIMVGALLYVTGAALAWAAPTLELMIAARILQGLGAAGPRVVALAMIRDLYSGREMARIVSFAMLVFTLFPAVAPLMGAGIIAVFGWRAIFVSFLIFSVVSVGWLMLRQPETLPRPKRKPLNAGRLWAATQETLSLRQMQLSILVQTLIYGVLFGMISSIQQIFDLTYGAGAHFHWYFAGIALLASPASPLNGRLVIRLGMRPLVRRALVAQIACAGVMIAVFSVGYSMDVEFWVFFAWCVTVFSTLGFTIGNLNALALEPLGHIAGLAASLMGALSTVGGAILGGIIGQLYDGTVLPIALATIIGCAVGAAIMVYMPREGR